MCVRVCAFMEIGRKWGGGGGVETRMRMTELEERVGLCSMGQHLFSMVRTGV